MSSMPKGNSSSSDLNQAFLLFALNESDQDTPSDDNSELQIQVDRRRLEHQVLAGIDDDALSEIFSYIGNCAQDTFDVLSLGFVCTHWHHLVSCSASIWETIDFSTSKKGFPRVNGNLLNDQVLRKLLYQHGKFVKNVNLYNCTRISDLTIRAIARHCPQLEAIELDQNSWITEIALEYLLRHHGSQIHTLRVSGVTIHSSIAVEAISRYCKNLKLFHIAANCKICDNSLLQILLSCRNLTHLNLIGCSKISDESARNIALHCKMIVELKLSSKDITEIGIIAIASTCSFLQTVFLGGCVRIRDNGIILLVSECKSIRKLNLFGCSQLTDIAMYSIAVHCQDIEYLNIGSCQVGDLGIRALVENCSHLSSIDLWNCYKVTNESILSLAKHSRCLQSLNLRHCYEVSDEALLAIAEFNFESLSVLDLSDLHQLTDQSVSILIQRCSHLKTLHLHSCSSISDESLLFLSRCSELFVVDIGGCNKVTDATLLALVQGCPKLNALNMEECVLLTDTSVHAIARHSHHLCNLNIAGCPKIGSSSLIALSQGCKWLSFLDCRNIPSLTYQALMYIAEYSKRLAHLDIRGSILLNGEQISGLVGKLPSDCNVFNSSE